MNKTDSDGWIGMIGEGGITGFLWKRCFYHVIAEKKNLIPLFDVNSSTLPFFVEEG